MGALDPALDGEEPYIEVPRHLADRTAAPHRGHQVPAATWCASGPIMVTTMAALMGTLPIAVGIGARADSRRSLGLAVGGGLILSQLLTLYARRRETVPGMTPRPVA